MIQLISAAMFLTQIGSLKIRPKLSLIEKVCEKLLLSAILAMNLYVLSCNTLYDSRLYHDIHGLNGTAKFHPRWYGFWQICGTKHVIRKTSIFHLKRGHVFDLIAQNLRP